MFDNEHYYYVKHIPVANLNISILGLNSACLAGSDKDQGNLVLGDIQVRKASTEVENADICMAIMHHPFDWFQKFDRGDIESLLSKECDFILHGHLHEQSINQISGPGRFSTVVGAGACFEKRTSFNSYNFVQLDLDSGKGKIHLRMYSDRDSGFWTNDTITYSVAPNGAYEFPLPAHICKPLVEESVIESQESKAEVNTQVTQLTGIPLRPQPYFAHFFHLQANFTGRVEERKMLTDWFNGPRNPLFVLLAIGGMGKSSLAWYWLKNDIDHSSLQGIFWWSFYEGEASFTKFLDDAIIYASGNKTNPADTKSNYEKSRILLSLLQQHRFLFVLDGLERQLGSYYDPKDSRCEEDSEDEMAQARACVDPYFGRFLCDLVSSEPKTKILITSRMRIHDLEDDSGNPFYGCHVEELKQFNHDDAFSFMNAQGVIKGTRKEILDACDVYRCHPLSLRLLSGLIARNLQNPGDISVAPRYDIHADLKARRHHILEVAFNSLPEELQKLLSEASAFRSTITYDALSIFNDFGNDLKFEKALKDLVDWSLLLFNKDNKHFDLHPIVRRYAYDRLIDKKTTHVRLQEYFISRFPLFEKLENLDDITPIIELYYHTVKAEQYEDAIKLYKSKLQEAIYFWFSAYQTTVELLLLLFPRGLDEVPCLQRENDQAYVLNELGQAYNKLGQTRLAAHAYNQAVKIAEKHCDKADLSLYKCDLADLLISMGKLKDAEKYLKYKMRGSQLNFDQMNTARYYAYLLIFKGSFIESSFLFNEIIKRLYKKRDPEQALSVTFNDKSRLFILMKRPYDAYKAAVAALEFWNKISEPYETDHIIAEWMIGQALIYMSFNSPDKRDELLLEAEIHLKEAIIRCHNVNLVESEPGILLSMALWHYAKGERKLAEDLAEEALSIANRCEYRLNQAEIHNFLARLYLDQDDKIGATQHVQIAFERAWCDGPPHCYKPALDTAKELLEGLGIKEPEKL